jgi:hypothetical protein
MKPENPYSAPQSTDFIPIAQQVEAGPVVDSPSSLQLLATGVGIMAGIFAVCKAIEWIITHI